MNAEHLEAYLAGELSSHARRQVEHVLRNDADLRESFLQQARIDAALGVLLSETGEEETQSFDESVMARLRSEGAGEERGFAKSVLTEIVEEREGITPLRWPDLVKAGLISAAASIALMFVLQGIMFRNDFPGGGSASSTKAGISYVARLEQSEDLEWSAGTAERVREDGWLSNGLLEIDSGRAMIAFNSGATAVIEGPASLSIESNNRVFLQSGYLTANVPPPATGFTVNTPRLNAVDIGTRFGVRVEANGDSELHVMEGEVEASRSSGNSVATLVREGLALRADGRTRSALEAVPYAGDAFVQRVGTLSLPQPALRYSFDESVGAVIEDTGEKRVYDVPLVGSGELGSSPRRAAGRFGGGLVLQSGEALDVFLARDFRLEEAYTISFWVKIPPRLGRTEDALLLRYGREGLSWDISCHLGTPRGARGALQVGFGEGYVTGSTDIADGNWHHVACRFIGGDDADIASHLHLFVDGSPETVSDFRSAPVEDGRAGSLRIGSHGDNGLAGWIDELHLFREAVPTPVIQSLGKEE